MPKEKLQIKIVALAGVILALFVLGFLFPEALWATNHTAAFPPAIGISLLLLAAGLIVMPLFLPSKPNKKPTDLWPLKRSLALFGGISIVSGFLFFNIEPPLDTYGDAPFLVKSIDVVVEDWDPRLASELFSFNPTDSKIGTVTLYSLTNFGSYLTGSSGLVILKWIDAFSGMAWVFLWLVLVRYVVKTPRLRVVMSLMGCAAPFLLMFFGHIEIYSPSMPLMLGFLGSLVYFFRQKKKRNRLLALILSGFLWLLNLKFHITAYLLLPALLLAILWYFQFSFLKKFFNWKWVSILLGIPGFLVVSVLYLFVTNSFRGERFYTEDTLNDVLFLPVIASDGPPLDRYNLFSLAHILDFVGLIIFCSAGAVFLLLAFLLFFRRRMKWNQPSMLTVGFTAIIYIGAFFLLNPLLGITADWDLFCRPAPVILMFALLGIGQFKSDSSGTRAMEGGVLAFGLMGLVMIVANLTTGPLANHLLHQGKHSFKTYWKGSSSEINASVFLREGIEKKLEVRNEVLNDLEPYAIEGVDVEYADLAHRTGIIYMDSLGQNEAALTYFETAYKYDPNLRKNPYRLVVCNFVLGQFEEALQYLPKLIQFRYPDRQKAYQMAIHTAVEGKAYEEALSYCREFLEIWPDNDFVKRLEAALSSGENLDEVRLMFRQG